MADGQCVLKASVCTQLYRSLHNQPKHRKAVQWNPMDS